jgi:hypothetical protein
MVLACLYIFRSAALAVYVLCGLFTDNYVLSVSTLKGTHEYTELMTEVTLDCTDCYRRGTTFPRLLERQGMFALAK